MGWAGVNQPLCTNGGKGGAMFLSSALCLQHISQICQIANRGLTKTCICALPMVRLSFQQRILCCSSHCVSLRRHKALGMESPLQTVDWGHLPFAVLDNVRERLGKSRKRQSAMVACARLVNRHWCYWAAESEVVLNLSGSLPLELMVHIAMKRFTRVVGLLVNGSVPMGGDMPGNHLSCLEKLTHLRQLKVVGSSSLTQDSLGHVAHLRRLKRLTLQGCGGVSQGCLSHLVCLTALETLDLDTCANLLDNSLEHVGQLTSLKRLSLIGCTKVTDAGLAHIGSLTGLEWLAVYRCQGVSDSSLQQVGSLTALRTFHFGRCPRAQRFLADISKCKALESMILSGFDSLCLEDLMHVASLRGLRQLTIHMCPGVSDDGLQCIAGLTALKRLVLQGCAEITDAGLAHISSLPILERLTLYMCQKLTDHGLHHIGRLTTLRRLRLDRCPRITDKALAHMGRWKTLESLELRACGGITNKGLEQSQNMRSLVRLKVDWCEKVGIYVSAVRC
ncbi:unnamed protein product [Ostreobium quekettii]|uniref:Uncharacterized protein n=1 Tax=Ostreobium quekettii TaxID=121088 RepID=A0A8S1JBS7_9CHLO|nr:unnamed protein product [Ostreobium quekettii]